MRTSDNTDQVADSSLHSADFIQSVIDPTRSKKILPRSYVQVASEDNFLERDHLHHGVIILNFPNDVNISSMAGQMIMRERHSTNDARG